MQPRIICSYRFKSGVSGWIVIWGISQKLKIFTNSLQMQD